MKTSLMMILQSRHGYYILASYLLGLSLLAVLLFNSVWQKRQQIKRIEQPKYSG